MQFGTLLLPILGGYLFLVTCYLTRFIAVRDTGYHLFFKSAIAGSVLFTTAFAVVALTESLSIAIQDVWPSHVAIEYLGTSALSLALGLVMAQGVNVFCNKEKCTQKAAEKRGDRLELMLANSSNEQMQVEITLRSGKSYIGYVVQSPFAVHGKADVEIFPTASGYRKPDTQELRLTTHYSDILNSFNDTSSSINLSPEHFRIAIHMSEVISVRLFDPIIYNLYFSLDEMQ